MAISNGKCVARPDPLSRDVGDVPSPKFDGMQPPSREAAGEASGGGRLARSVGARSAK